MFNGKPYTTARQEWMEMSSVSFCGADWTYASALIFETLQQRFKQKHSESSSTQPGHPSTEVLTSAKNIRPIARWMLRFGGTVGNVTGRFARSHFAWRLPV